MFDPIPVPTPFQIGDVNAYLAGRTLIDPGPDSDEAWAALSDGLAARGLEPADVELVVITHPHPDHFGLATRLRDEGARAAAGVRGAPIVEDFEGRYEYERAYFTDFFAHHGMPRKAAETALALPEQFLGFAPNVTVDDELRDGDAIEVADREVTVRSTMGHAAEELLLVYDADGDRRAVVGDHVLGDITPNPALQPPDAMDDRRPRMLPTYNRSLEALRDDGFDLLYPGHREPIADPPGRIEDILAAHEERTANVRDLVDGPRTAFEVMEGLFEGLPVTEYFAGMSEAVGHLDVLLERGKVERSERDGTIVYEGTSG